jgi:ribosomal protein L29
MYYTIKQRLAPASREALECFTFAELRRFVKDLGLEQMDLRYRKTNGRASKSTTIRMLLESGKATILVSLGN